MTYREYQNMRQEGFNALPVFFLRFPTNSWKKDYQNEV